MNYAIILAAGSSVRMKGINKAFARISGQPVIYWTLTAFEKHPQISNIVLVGKKEDQKRLQSLVKNAEFKKVAAIVGGGIKRQDSVYQGLSAGQRLGWEKDDLILIHDGVRMLIKTEEIDRAILGAQNNGASTVGVSIKDTIHKVDKAGFLIETPSRESLFAAHTPQVIKFHLALTSFSKAQKEGLVFTDDVSLIKYYNPDLKVSMVCGSYENLKITTPEDLITVENIMRLRKND